MHQEHLDLLISKIKDKNPALASEAKRLRKPETANEFDKFDHRHWCISAMSEALVKLRIFTEDNFNYIETMSLISVTRYILELSVWVKLFELDQRYGLVYYNQLIKTQKHYWTDYKSQLEREIDLLNSLQNKETELTQKEIQNLSQLPEEQQEEVARGLGKKVMSYIDDKAARNFSIYSEEAKTKGYGYQAHIVETNVKLEIDKSLQEILNEEIEFKKNISDEINKLIPKRWNWRDMAKKVGMDDDYDFIYAFSSKLIHATPASLTTNHKKLEICEMIVFLRYILVKINDIIEYSGKY